MSTNTVVTTTPPLSMVESVLIKGDLSSLSSEQRGNYYMQVCESVGLNPLTKPFEYITLNGKLTLYALRTCTDQLRTVHKVSVESMDETERDGVFIVTAKVRNGEGRTDMAKGAVNISGLKGDNLANALMKAETKAKRRATLSICGLGMLDETEVETIPNAPIGVNQTVIEKEPAKPTFKQTDTLRPHKEEYAIEVEINPDGTLNYDQFAADLEHLVMEAKDLKTTSLLNRANSKVMREMEKERPELFKAVGDAFRNANQAMM